MGDIGKIKTHWQNTDTRRGARGAMRGNAANIGNPQSVTDVLRNARLLQGYSLHEAASALNIRLSHLAAIEDGRFKELPPLVYAQGFVAAYAGFLGLDRSEIVARFKDEASREIPLHTSYPNMNVPEAFGHTNERSSFPSITALIVAIILSLAAYGAWSFLNTQGSSTTQEGLAETVPPLPERFQHEPAALPAPQLPSPVVSTTNTAAVAIPPAVEDVQNEIYSPEAEEIGIGSQTVATSTTITPPMPPLEEVASLGIITIRALSESWIQLRNSQGQRVASLILKAGDGYTLPANAVNYHLITGNIAGLEISVDGQTIPPMTGQTQTSRAEYILDATRLKNGTARLN